MRIVICICALFIVSGKVFLKATPTDSTFIFSERDSTYYHLLHDVQIIRKRPPLLLQSTHEKIGVDIDAMETLPKFMGTSDPIRYLQSIAGVQTNGEGNTGIYIQGCADYQTIVSINDAPIYYPNHLLGLFSAFIPTHFQKMELVKSAHRTDFANRLGGEVLLKPYESYHKKIGIEGNVGLINSDLTMPISFGKGGTLMVSARSSYISLLYGPLLNFANMDFGYDFQDFNVTYSLSPTPKDRIVISTYYGIDKMTALSEIANINIYLKWNNAAASSTWTHKTDNWNIHTSIHYSRYSNAINVDETDNIQVNTASMFSSIGMKNNNQISFTSELSLQFGIDYNHYWNNPQYVSSHGLATNFHSDFTLLSSDELSLYAGLRHAPFSFLTYDAGLRISSYAHKKKIFFALDPRININFPINKSQNILLHYGIYHQYFHKAGMTDGGLPTDYFFLVDKNYKPEYAHSISIAYNTAFPNNNYSFIAELYFKQLYNVVESQSNILELMMGKFNYMSGIITGKGRNYGINLLLHKNKGIVRGYLSYSLGWAMRNFPDIAPGYTIPAKYDRRHNLVAVSSVQINRRWRIGGMFTLASGNPYTKPKYAYILNGKIICEYGPYNGATLPLYHRLDISADYLAMDNHIGELGINLSLYNVYCHDNIQFIIPSNDFTMKPVSIINTILPSLSIYFNF